ncbi:MAG: hypothetical protein RTU30_05660 [Candidatus Thorarchaeota archaeon]
METDRKRFWRISLVAMKKSIQNTYRMQTHEMEMKRFLDAWTWSPEDSKLVVFSDYRRNEGRRRLEDILELIDNALLHMGKSSQKSASRIYVDTMRQVARYSTWYAVLEKSSYEIA